MAAGKRKAMMALEDEQEAVLRRIMFAEYREENAKDMAREAAGEW